MMPMNQGVNSEAGAEQHPRPTVASSRQLSAANKRRKNAAPGRFICDLCSQHFTSRHNLKSQRTSTAFVFFFFFFLTTESDGFEKIISIPISGENLTVAREAAGVASGRSPP